MYRLPRGENRLPGCHVQGQNRAGDQQGSAGVGSEVLLEAGWEQGGHDFLQDLLVLCIYL